ncbi:hypothetical protein NDA14_007927 [Ustilago hordei]|nr:hypothetical protein NDA10_007039 [Ustilago hordei]KAJ1598418.1 hypothetical protein NDA14_007927 [Ustilago hordei]UTT92752.1 hypothetical protein NDA17_001034 [Ustilago hordei]
MPPRDYPDRFIHPRHSLPTPCIPPRQRQQPSQAARPASLAATATVTAATAAAAELDHLQPPSQQRFTLPFARPAALEYRSSSPVRNWAYPTRSAPFATSEPSPSYTVACRIPSSLSQQYQLPAQDQDDDDNSSDCESDCIDQIDQASEPKDCSSLTRTPSFPSIAATMSAAAPIDLLPRMGPGSGMHSPFSIPHSLFNHDTGPSTFSSLPRSPLLATPMADTSSRKKAALLDALARPSSAMQASNSSASLSGANTSSLDLSQNAGSSLSAGGSFGGPGAYSSSNGSAFGGSSRISGGNGGPGARRDDSQRDSGSANANGSGGGNGQDPSNDANDKDKGKKTNPLVDLLETEAAYVSELSKIIKKVAAAWSRSNFPPPELDTMFRNVEAIYRANRSFLKALKEIGPNPSSPKALGDLLMKWIDDLEAPYTRFCESYLADFDAWGVVQSNPRISKLLEEVSGATDAEGNPMVFSDRKRDPNEPWTLDSLFALPHIRLRYYKKLYSRLLKSTQPGRSDHRLLVRANDKLDELVEKSKRRLAVSVLEQVAGRESQSRDSSFAESNVTGENSPRDRVSSATSTSDTQSPSVRPVQTMGGKLSSPPRTAPVAPAEPSNNAAAAAALPASTSNPTLLPAAGRAPTPGGMPMFDAPTTQLNGLNLEQPLSVSPSRPDLIRGNSEAASVHDSNSQTTGDDSASTRTNSLTQPIAHLENRLDTSKTLDIFTMKPKKCQLQMHPPNLPFARALRKSADVVIHFTPSSGGPEISIRRAHIFLLTDLFLVCERMTPSERAEMSKGGVGSDMWLLYPPLAGKHLRVADEGGQGNVLSITVLRKEKLIVHTDSKEAKEDWLEHFSDCNKFAANMGLKVRTSNPALSAPSAGSSLASGPSLTTPALSPAISVTPSSAHGHENEEVITGPSPFSPEGGNSPVIGSDLSRQASFNSVASFPKVAALGSPDLGGFGLGGSSAFSPRSPSPSQFGPGTPFGGPPGVRPGMQQQQRPGGPPSPMNARPGMMSPQQNGAFSPDTSPAFGPSRFGPNGPGSMHMGRPPLMQDPNMPPRSPGSGPMGMRGPPGVGSGMPFPRGGPSPVPGQMPGGPGNSPGFGPMQVRPGMGPGGPVGPMPPFANGAPRPPMQRPPPPGGPGGPHPWGHGPPPPPPPNGMLPREPMRRPSAPNLRQASHGSSANGGSRTSDEAEGGSRSFIRTRSVSSTGSTAPKLPSAMMKEGRDRSERGTDISPPSSPVAKKSGPFRSTVSAQMRCKLFLKQSHAQWKSLGNARLKLYHILPNDIKQLVVENDRKTLISTIVLTDGVERVGKVGVAVELSDRGNRTGIVYMLQMRSEESAAGLFGQLLEGSDRAAGGVVMG